MSYFNNRFNPRVYSYVAGNSYNKDDIVMYNGYSYIALQDVSVPPEEKTTNEYWEYIDGDSNKDNVTNVITTIAPITNVDYKINLGAYENPFFAANLLNALNFTVKNKSTNPVFKTAIRFGPYMADYGSTGILNVMYDSDFQNPYFIVEQENGDETTIGNGIKRFKDVYTTSGSTTLADDNYMDTTSIDDLDDKYLELFKKLRPIKFKLFSDYSSSSRYHIGFLAEEVEKAMEELNIDTKDFAGLVKIPVLKKDLYYDIPISDCKNKHCHYELDEEVQETDVDFNDYNNGENIIRYVRLPEYKGSLAYFYFKNYPINSSEDTSADDLDITVKSMELIPYNSDEEPYIFDFSKHVVYSEGNNNQHNNNNNEAHHEILEDGSLKLTFDKDCQYMFTRVSFSESENNDAGDVVDMDLSNYKYVRLVLDFKREFLNGFSDLQSAIDYDSTDVDHCRGCELGDQFSFALDRQYEVATYIYALRYEEFLPLAVKKIQTQDEVITSLTDKIEKLEQTVQTLVEKVGE